MPKRREPRVTMPIPVKIWGLDTDGRVFSQNAKTVNITRGARLFGGTAKQDPGFTLGLQCGCLKGRLSWSGSDEAKTTPKDKLGYGRWTAVFGVRA